VIVPTPEGRSDFHALEQDLGAGRSDRFVFYAFDLLYLDGLDLRNAALLDRKQILAELLAAAAEPFRFSEHVSANGPAVFKNACDLELEGIVSKRIDRPYRSGRNDNWFKTTCRHRAGPAAMIAKMQLLAPGNCGGREDAGGAPDRPRRRPRRRSHRHARHARGACGQAGDEHHSVTRKR